MVIIDDTDRHVWNLITEVPRVKMLTAIFSLIMNVFIPGSGTIMITCVADVFIKT